MNKLKNHYARVYAEKAREEEREKSKGVLRLYY